MTAPSIWGCVEMDAASRDFDYADYLSFHNKTGCVGTPVSSVGYRLVCVILHSSICDGATKNSKGPGHPLV